MDKLGGLLRELVEWSLWPFDAMPPQLAFVVISLLTGATMLWIVGRVTPQKWVGKSRDRMVSAIYETRLFLDNPGRVLLAQGRLLFWSLVYIGTMLPALLLLAVPLGMGFLHLDARFGFKPLSKHDHPVVMVVTKDAQVARQVSLVVGDESRTGHQVGRRVF